MIDLALALTPAIHTDSAPATPAAETSIVVVSNASGRGAGLVDFENKVVYLAARPDHFPYN